MFVFADSHIKNILMNCVSVLSSMATGWIPIKWQEGESNRALISIDKVSEVEIRCAPRSSTPQAKSFSERKRVTHKIEEVRVGVTKSSNEFFSSKLFAEVRMLAGSSMLRLTVE